MKKRIAYLVLAVGTLFVQLLAAQSSIIPKPNETVMGEGSFTIDAATKIGASEATQKAAVYLRNYLQKYHGLVLMVSSASKSPHLIGLTITADAKKPKGAYSLSITNNAIHIVGVDAAGCFYGVQSLIQLLPLKKASPLQVASLAITDAPRFGYRGSMLDVSRHFYPIDFVKKYIDYLALHKINTFHWHLTDDQGWRIEIKKYPRLTSVGGYRHGTITGGFPGTGNTNQRYGGFYTQAQAKEIVQYAADRYITVIPEIEMPGHASAAIAAYPQLSCFPNEPTIKYHPKGSPIAGDTTGKQVVQSWGVYDDVYVPSENTFKFLQDVLDEVMPLFPSTYIHIGGDECPKTNWKRSAFCQQLIKEKGLTDEHGLQSYFVQRMEKYINSKGKKIIGWDEILEGGLAPNASVMSWRGEKGGIEAAKQKHPVIMTPADWCYFDHSQTKKEDSLVIGGYLPIDKVYSFDPVPHGLTPDEALYILGGQCNLWTEYINNSSKVEYMLFPRLSAMSEALWSLPANKDYKDFDKRLQAQYKQYNWWGINYFGKN